MNLDRRRVVGLGIGIAVTVAFIAITAAVLTRWHERGWAAMTITPYIKTSGPRPATVPSFGKEYALQSVVIVFPGGPAHRAGLRAGDKVISISGVDFRDAAALRALDSRVSTGDMLIYKVERSGQTLEIPVTLQSPLRLPLTLLQTIVSALVGFVFVGTGFLIFGRRSDDRRAVIFYILTLVAGNSMIAATATQLNAGIRGIDPNLGLRSMAVLLFVPVTIAFLPLTLHLALIFPRDRPVFRKVPRVLWWVYGLPVAALTGLGVAVPFLMVLKAARPAAGPERWAIAGIAAAIAIAIVTAGSRLLWRAAGHRLNALASRPLTIFVSWFLLLLSVAVLVSAAGAKIPAAIILLSATGLPLLLLIGMPIVSCVVLYLSYRDANVEERRQVAWPLWGTIIALSVRMTVLLVNMVIGAYLQATGGDFIAYFSISQYIDIASRALYVLIPLSFAIAIFKYRLMNIDVLIRKTVVYTILSGAIVFVYLVVVGGLGTVLVRSTGLKNQTMVIAATLMVGMMFVPVRNKLQTLVDRNLFRHKYDYPEALRAIAAEALTAHDVNAFLPSAAEKLQQALQNRAVVIFVPRHDELVAVAKVGVADTLIGRLRFAAAAFASQLDRPFDPRRRALPDDATAALKRIDAVLVVPINTPGTAPNGVIALAPKLSGAEFDVEDIDFLRSIADQLDVGIDRIRMQRDDADYAQARTIQESLLPREMPHVQGIDVSGSWQPARTVGGDYYDLLQLSDHEMALCIGDVAGKGMPAALLMSGLQAAVRASAGRSPKELCERVRRVVVSSLSGGRFVTFFYAVLDTSAMRLRWCNAGHNAPILARADGTIVRLEDGGPAFSRLTRDGAFVEREIEVGEGDRLVLFTDGASEVMDESGEMFGEERLEQLVAANRSTSASELQQLILASVTGYARGELEDDLTLVVAGVSRHPQFTPRADEGSDGGPAN